MTHPQQIIVGEATSPEARLAAKAFRHWLFCKGLCGEKLERCTLGKFDDHADDVHSRFYLASRRIESNRRTRLQHMAVGRLITNDLPTWRILPRLPEEFEIDLAIRYCESSRMGLHRDFHGTLIGYSGTRLLIGSQFDDAVEKEGCEDYLLTIRYGLYRAFPWLPWRLGKPFHFQASEGGPLKQGPVWTATLNLRESVYATRHFRAYDKFFEGEKDWRADLRPNKRKQAELDELYARNRAAVIGFMREWEDDPRILQPLQPLQAEAG